MPLSVDEYLELEKSATVRHEYAGGMVYVQAGTTKLHNRIAGNIFASDVKIRAAEALGELLFGDPNAPAEGPTPVTPPSDAGELYSLEAELKENSCKHRS